MTEESVMGMPEEEAAVNKLHKIKRMFEQGTDKRISFIKLLRDEDFRNKVLNEAISLGGKPAKLAKEVLEKNFKGSLHLEDLKREQGTNASDANLNSAFIDKKIKSAVELAERKLREQLEATIARYKRSTSILAMLLMVTTATLIYPFVKNHFTQTVVEVTGTLPNQEVWSSDKEYILSGTVVFSGSELIIEPGTIVKGKPGSALIIAKGSKLNAVGTQEAPIVFSSIKSEGKRARGDWSGIYLLGDSTINGEGLVAGLNMEFGGTDRQSSCGSVQHVRIEFAGHFLAGSESPAMTIGACGSNTKISNLHIHKPLAKGVSVLGGSVNMKNILVSGAGSSGLDWDLGWDGNLQYLIVQMHPDDGQSALSGSSFNHLERIGVHSGPTIANASLIGAGSNLISHQGIFLKDSGLKIYNSFATGFTSGSVDIAGVDAEALSNDGKLIFDNMFFYESVRNAEYFADESGARKNDDLGFNEEQFFYQKTKSSFGVELALNEDFSNIFKPDFAPEKHSLLNKTSIQSELDSFFDATSFAGAVEAVDTEQRWYSWTQFPSS